MALPLLSDFAVIPGEDADALAALSAEYHDHYRPVGPVETSLVDTLVQSEWLKRRYIRIETAILTHLLAQRPDDPNALGAIYGEAAASSPLHKMSARIEAASRTWFRARKELDALQAERTQFVPEQEETEAETESQPRAGRSARVESWLRSEPERTDGRREDPKLVA